jgi:hypothetical protein
MQEPLSLIASTLKKGARGFDGACLQSQLLESKDGESWFVANPSKKL